MKPRYLLIPLVTILVASAGSWITGANMYWYMWLHVPAYTPPGPVIGAIWSTIYILTTVSALMAWSMLPHDRSFAAVVATFVANAVLNVGWCAVFFGLHLIGPGIWVAAALGLSVVVLIGLLARRLLPAALLLVPYAVWVAFATYLNYVLWRLN